jgi:hypothetical protein
MAATTIRDLLVRLGVDADIDGLDKFDDGLQTIALSLSAVSVAAIGTIGVLFGVTSATAAAGDEAAKTAQQLGLTSDAYQELLFAAERSGASQEQLAVGLKTIQRLAFDAANGNAEAAKTFEQLGISVTDANGNLKSGEQLLLEAADAISKLDNEAEKIALAQKLFGEGGAALLPLLDRGSKGIDELRRRARELGFVLDEDATRASEQFSDSLLDAKAVLEGIRNTIGVALLPVFTALLDLFVAGAQVVQPIIAGFVDFIENTVGLEAAGAALLAVLGFIAASFGALGALLGSAAVAGVLSSIIGFFSTLATILGTTLAPAVGIFVAALGALLVTLGSIAAALATTIGFLIGWLLLFEDFLVFLRDGKSVIGEFVEEFAGTEGVFGAVADGLLVLRELLFQVWELVGALGELAVAILVPAFQALWTAIQPVLDLLLALLVVFVELQLQSLENWIRGVIVALELITDTVAFVTASVQTLVDLLAGAAQLAGALGVIDVGAVGGVTNNTTNNLNVTTNAPITTTGGADETAAAVSGTSGDAVAQAFAAVSGSEA